MALPLLGAAALGGGASLLSGLIGGSSQASAARKQARALQRYLGPYAQAGQDALSQQMALMGMGSPEEQAAMIAQLEGGPEYQALVEQGENAMLANASATGGLRGGNLQGALAQFRPQMLSQLINQQMSRLGGIAGMGYNAASTLGTGVGQANAAGALARGSMWNSIPNAIMGGLGTYAGLGGKFTGPNDVMALLGGGLGGGSAGGLIGGRMDASGGW